tara:strand:+ start:3944 stop:4522 length:579 start_codon:yes stop_codon:yes gene_type:complete
MNLHLFSKVLQLSHNEHHSEIEKNISERCTEIKKKRAKGGKGWLTQDVYNSFNVYDIVQDKVFESLNNWIDDQIISYCDSLKYKNVIKSKKGWFNIYKKGDFQEYHQHGQSHLSAIYCLKGDKKGARIFFRNEMNMFRPPVKEHTSITGEYYWIPFIPGQLVIFESSLMHSVEKHLCSTLRFSLSYNYCLKE